MNASVRGESNVTSLRSFFSVVETILFKTNKKRWRRVASAGAPPWDDRNRLIAGFIPARASVIDLGSGAQTLRTHLSRDCEYQPCDLIKSTEDVIVCDFNAGVYPTPARRYTHVVCSGVLEYIRDHRRFLREIRDLGDNLIVSYNLRVQGQTKLQRMTNNWVNHFTREELENEFRLAGLTGVSSHTSECGEAIYRLAKAE